MNATTDRYPRTEWAVLAVALGAAAGYVVLRFLGTDGWPDALRFAVGLLPALGLAAGILVEMRIIRRIDELQQRIQLEAFAFGYPTAILLIVAVRFVQAEGFLASWRLGDIWPFLLLPYFVGLALAVRRYR